MRVAVCAGSVLMSLILAILVMLMIVFVFVFGFVRHYCSLAFLGLSCAKLSQKRRFLQGMNTLLINFARKLRSLLVK